MRARDSRLLLDSLVVSGKQWVGNGQDLIDYGTSDYHYSCITTTTTITTIPAPALPDLKSVQLECNADIMKTRQVLPPDETLRECDIQTLGS